MNKAVTKHTLASNSGTSRRFALGLSLAVLMFTGTPAQAASIVNTLGNNVPGFNAGDSVGIIQLLGAQSGQPAPFDQGYGSDPASNFNQSWTFNFGAIADTILSAQIAFGIVDSDSGSAGDQVASFTIDGIDFTSSLNSLFETTASASGVYDVYTLSLTSLMLPNLLDGSTTVALALKGPVLSPGIPGITLDQIDNFNGAALIYSTLSIETRATNNNVPEPSMLLLVMTGLFSAFGFKARRNRS